MGSVMKKQRKNPLEPFPDFEGTPAWGGTEGGVHTADRPRQALAYAALKGDPEREDYPVILALKVTDQEPQVDLDAYRAAKALAPQLRNPDLTLDEFYDWMEAYLLDEEVQLDAEAGESTINWLFRHSDPNTDYNLFEQFHEYLEETPAGVQEDVFERARQGKLTNDEKMAIFGQRRYQEPIGPESVLAVYFVKPFWPEVMKIYYDDDDVEVVDVQGHVVDFESFLNMVEPYFNVVVETDQSTRPTDAYDLQLVWGEDTTSWPDVEYHGTSWKNLKKALPEIAEQIEPPPDTLPAEFLAEDVVISVFGLREELLRLTLRSMLANTDLDEEGVRIMIDGMSLEALEDAIAAAKAEGGDG
jgi:hypothetical protein